MRTLYQTKKETAAAFLCTASAMEAAPGKRPERFKKLMKSHRGSCLEWNPCEADGLLKHNPLIVALGDSVTAGHFEWLTDLGQLTQKWKKILQDLEGARIKAIEDGSYEEPPVLNVTDTRESYAEKFRLKLIEKYETTSVSMLNAGIAGDNLIGMNKRLHRDVISHHPDLVLINGALNWSKSLGTTKKYKEILKNMVNEIRDKTEADIILLTPNGSLPNPMALDVDMLPERVEAIRETAAGEGICLADHYAVWEKFREKGYEWKDMLANNINHPSITGHEGYAITLMKLFD